MTKAATSSGTLANDPAASLAENLEGIEDVAEESESQQGDESLSPEAEVLQMLDGDQPATGQAETTEEDEEDEDADEAAEDSEDTADVETESKEEAEEGDEAKVTDEEATAEAKAEADDPEEELKKASPGVQKRMNELTAARRGAEEALLTERQQSAHLQQQIVQLTAAREDVFGLTAVPTPEALEKRSTQLDAEAEKWELVIDQGYEVDKEGERQELDDDRRKLLTGYVRDVRKAVAHAVPIRQRFFAERQAWNGRAAEKFPWLSDPKDPRTEYAARVISSYPQISPAVFAPAVYAAACVTLYELGDASKQKPGGQAAAKGTAPGKTAGAVKKPLVQKKPAQRTAANVIDSEKDAEAWVASQL